VSLRAFLGEKNPSYEAENAVYKQSI